LIPPDPGNWWGLWWNHLIPRASPNSHLRHSSGGSLWNQRKSAVEHRGLRRLARWPRTSPRCAARKRKPNSDAIAGGTSTALWLFLLPIFKQLLNRKKQHTEEDQGVLLPCVCLHPVLPTDNNEFLVFSAGFIGVGQRSQYQQMHSYAYGNAVPIIHLSQCYSS
jgi:hypothetical protein